MFEYVYEWLRNISYYLILVTAVTYVLPSNSYRKYIRFFTGLVLIMMLLTPVFQLFGVQHRNSGDEFELNIPELVESVEEFDNSIEVEDIVIGH